MPRLIKSLFTMTHTLSKLESVSTTKNVAVLVRQAENSEEPLTPILQAVAKQLTFAAHAF